MARKTNILILDAGGRGHALGWKLRQSPRVGEIFFAPGNGGTREVGKNIPKAKCTIEALANVAAKNKCLTVVGSDEWLAQGVVDYFHTAGLPIFGPTRRAAEIEWSKEYAKRLMLKYEVPTARHEVFSDYGAARIFLRKCSYPRVIKKDGLARGKGVKIVWDSKEGERVAKQFFREDAKRIIIEEYLDGEEFSAHVLCDAHVSILLSIARDYKRLRRDMGGYLPVSQFNTSVWRKRIQSKLVDPVLTGLTEERRPFRGLLYPGGMRVQDEVKAIEYNVRFGDPEAELFMMYLETDLFEILNAALKNELNEIEVRYKKGYVVGVVLASGGYAEKENFPVGFRISGITRAKKIPGVEIFHMGTKKKAGAYYTAGGRVLWVGAHRNTLSEARRVAYQAAKLITFKGMQCRPDIAE
jgi:phosphoribosylamine---glycine ligase